MKIQVLVATMNQNDHSLINEMNIKTDAIIGNQCSLNSVEDFMFKNQRIIYLNSSERGVGVNRNSALMRANADICIFADDDMIFDDNYVETVTKVFHENPQADVIIFNIREKNVVRKINKKKKRVWYFNYLRYGTARIAIRLKNIRKYGIYFNQCFGGGTEHYHGEDNLFLNACLKNKLVVLAIPEYIATLTDNRESSWRESSWSSEHNEKYLKDQGVLYKTLSRRWWKILCLQDAIRRSKRDYKMPWYKAYGKMRDSQ